MGEHLKPDNGLPAAERALRSGDCAGSRSLYMSSTVAGSMTVPGSPRRRRPPSAGDATLAPLPGCCWLRCPVAGLPRRLAGDRDANCGTDLARSTSERKEPERLSSLDPADAAAAAGWALVAAEAAVFCPGAAAPDAG